MKLDKEQKEFLKKQLGYTDADIETICQCRIRLEYYNDRDPESRDIPIDITYKDAIDILGKWGFASGCARATFHDTACRTAMSGLDTILFERV